MEDRSVVVELMLNEMRDARFERSQHRTVVDHSSLAEGGSVQ